MSGEGVVTISANRLLDIADRLRDLEADLRKLGLNGFKAQPASRAPLRGNDSEAMEVNLDIAQITFK